MDNSNLTCTVSLYTATVCTKYVMLSAGGYQDQHGAILVQCSCLQQHTFLTSFNYIYMYTNISTLASWFLD